MPKNPHKLHWTQKPENKRKLTAMIRKGRATRELRRDDELADDTRSTGVALTKKPRKKSGVTVTMHLSRRDDAMELVSIMAAEDIAFTSFTIK